MGAGRRVADILLSILGLLASSPMIAVMSVALWLQDGFPIFFRQVRVGRNGKRFGLWKLRSMRTGSTGSLVTAGNDSRITPLGAFLRRYKLDEFPQLWNVLKGDMSLIGPRPEVPPYVEESNATWQRILAHRPGITDFATLLFRDEERILALQPDPEHYYREKILPSKLALNIEYLDKRSFLSDVRLILLTIRYSFFPSKLDSGAIRKAVLSPPNQ